MNKEPFSNLLQFHYSLQFPLLFLYRISHYGILFLTERASKQWTWSDSLRVFEGKKIPVRRYIIIPKYPGKYLRSILLSGWKNRVGGEKETRRQVDLRSKGKPCKSYWRIMSNIKEENQDLTLFGSFSAEAEGDLSG